MHRTFIHGVLEQVANYVSIFLTLAVLLQCSSDQPGSVYQGTNRISNLYRFDKRDVKARLAELGYPDFEFFRLTRNSTGTAVYLEGEKNTLVLSVDEVSMLPKPALVAMLNDDRKFVLWSNNLRDGGITWNGSQLPLSSPHGNVGTDPSGLYCFVETAQGNTQIFGERGSVLASISFSVDRMFLGDSEMYLFGYSKETASREEMCAVLHKVENDWILADRFTIARPDPSQASFYVEDMDLKTGTVILKDSYDFPYKSQWYLYTLHKKKLLPLGNASDYGIFLQHDLIRINH